MSASRSTFRWLGDRGFLVQQTEPPTYLAPEWVDAALRWVDAVIGLDDHSDTFTMLYADSRGVCRTYRMSLDANRWTLSTQPGPDFYQRFEGTFNDDHTVIDARWEASGDRRKWATDFTRTYHRLAGQSNLPLPAGRVGGQGRSLGAATDGARPRRGRSRQGSRSADEHPAAMARTGPARGG